MAAEAPAEEDARLRAAADTRMPPWYMPRPMASLDYWGTHFPLRLTNTLTRTKARARWQPAGGSLSPPPCPALRRAQVPFIPMSGRRVLWYMCGPTVYDVSHMGHARCYLSYDVVNRLLRNYFGYDVVQARSHCPRCGCDPA